MELQKYWLFPELSPVCHWLDKKTHLKFAPLVELIEQRMLLCWAGQDSQTNWAMFVCEKIKNSALKYWHSFFLKQYQSHLIYNTFKGRWCIKWVRWTEVRTTKTGHNILLSPFYSKGINHSETQTYKNAHIKQDNIWYLAFHKDVKYLTKVE